MNDDYLKSVLSEIEGILHHPAYLVGGLPRDFLLGRDVANSDVDLCSSLYPNSVTDLFRAAGRKAVGKGNKFGTVFTKIQLEGKYIPVEVTTFRTEVYQEGSRKPLVTYSDNLFEDLSRRDFTVNAIAIRLKGDHLHIIDPHGGQPDLEGCVLRSVGTPKRMFKDDPLRLLRMVRIASKLDFWVEDSTYAAARGLIHRLSMLSRERIVEEMDKILQLKDPTRALSMLMDLKAFNFFMPAVQAMEGFDQHNPYHSNNLWEHTMKTVAVIPSSELDLRWAALLHDTGKLTSQTWKSEGHARYIKHDLVSAVIAEQVCTYLKMSNQRRFAIVTTVRDHQNDDCNPMFRSADWTAKR